jgi:hypothetical protein
MNKFCDAVQGTMEKIRVALEHPSEAESLMLPDHMFGAKSLSAEALEAYLGQIRRANSMSRCVDALENMQVDIMIRRIMLRNNNTLKPRYNDPFNNKILQ